MIKKLLEVCDFQGGTQPPKDEWLSTPREGYIRMLQIRDYTQGEEKFIEYVLDNGKLHKCTEEDIMLSRYGYIGQAYMGLSGAYNVALVKVIKKEDILTKYLFYYFRSRYFQYHLTENVGARATIPGFNKSELKNAVIDIPSQERQAYIANVLSKIDEIIVQRQQELKTYDDLIKARFVEMFGDPETNPKNWEKRPLADVITAANNGMARRGNDEDGNIVMRLVELQNGYIDYSKPNRIILTEAEKKRYLLKDKDFLFARVNGNPENVGRCAVFYDIGEPVFHNDHIIRVHFDDDDLDGPFASALLNSEYGKRQLRNQVKTSAGQYTVSQDGVGAIVAILPPIEIQRQFAAFVGQVDKSKFAVQKALDKAQLLFDSLMQKYFGWGKNIWKQQ